MTHSDSRLSALKLDPTHTLFVVMDVQERLVAVMPDENRSIAVDNVIRLIQGARILRIPLVVTEQYPQGLGQTIDPVAQALKELNPPALPIDKVAFDGCTDARFVSAVERAFPSPAAEHPLQPKAVVLCGMEAHVCIYQTARSLVERGYAVHVACDATCSRRAENLTVAQMLLDKIGAVVNSTETVLFDLLARADGAEFKAIIKLVR